jgi:hypothetical protein
VLGERIERDEPRAQRVLGAVGADAPLPGLAPRTRELAAALARPARPQERVRVRDLVVEDERPSGLQMRMESAEPLAVVLAVTPSPNPPQKTIVRYV